MSTGPHWNPKVPSILQTSASLHCRGCFQWAVSLSCQQQTVALQGQLPDELDALCCWKRTCLLIRNHIQDAWGELDKTTKQLSHFSASRGQMDFNEKKPRNHAPRRSKLPAQMLLMWLRESCVWLQRVGAAGCQFESTLTAVVWMGCWLDPQLLGMTKLWQAGSCCQRWRSWSRISGIWEDFLIFCVWISEDPPPSSTVPSPCDVHCISASASACLIHLLTLSQPFEKDPTCCLQSNRALWVCEETATALMHLKVTWGGVQSGNDGKTRVG